MDDLSSLLAPPPRPEPRQEPLAERQYDGPVRMGAHDQLMTPRQQIRSMLARLLEQI